MGERPLREAVKVTIPYGRSTRSFTVPAANLREILQPNPVKASPGAARELIREAMANPVGSPRLEEMVRPSDTVAVMVDDLTRPTPASPIVHEILGRLQAAGVPERNVSIVVALGTHRAMTEEEIAQKLDASIRSRIRVLNHDFRDPSKLVHVGTSADGIPVWINRSVVEADVRIGVGNIVPHCVAGWSGGGKIIYPGVAGEQTVDGFHGEFGTALENRIGNIDAPVRKEIERLVKYVGLEFIVNVILTGDGGIYRVVAGDYVRAHRAGVEHARAVYSVRSRSRTDIAVVSSFPADMDFWQAGKAVYSGELMVRDGGTLILVTPCPDGVVHNHDLFSYMSTPPETLLQEMAAGRTRDRAAAAVGVRIGMILRRIRVVAVSDGLTRADIEGLGFRAAAGLQAAIDQGIDEYGDGCTISVLTHGGDLYPEAS